MYERYAGFSRYGDISKFITDPDLLQVTGDECVYIFNENDYDIAVDLEICYALFDEVKPFIAFLATQICELDNIAQRFHRKINLPQNAWSILRGQVSFIRERHGWLKGRADELWKNCILKSKMRC